MSGRRTPGTVGGHGEAETIDAGTSASIAMSTPAQALATAGVHAPVAAAEPPRSGGIPYAIGQASVVRIPVPGTDGLCIELRPRGRVPSGGSTSTLFFQDATGKRHGAHQLRHHGGSGPGPIAASPSHPTMP